MGRASGKRVAPTSRRSSSGCSTIQEASLRSYMLLASVTEKAANASNSSGLTNSFIRETT